MLRDRRRARRIVAAVAVMFAVACGGDGSTTPVTPPPPPTPGPLVLSSNALAITAAPAGAPPAPSTVALTSGGTVPVEGLSVRAIRYEGPASSWLSATLDASSTPTALRLSVPVVPDVEGALHAEVELGSELGSIRITVDLTLSIPALSAPATVPRFAEDFTQGLPPGRWEVSDRVLGLGRLHPGNVSLSAEGLVLSTPGGVRDGAQVRSLADFGLGRFEATLRCDAPAGSICAFFQYQPGVGDRADEIDVEILPDTRELLLGTYRAGVRSNSIRVPYPPGTDPRGRHRYAFVREPTRLTFYLDGQPVARFRSRLPQASMPLYLNLWWPTWRSGPPAPGTLTVRDVTVW
jgi:hypothetical protein